MDFNQRTSGADVHSVHGHVVFFCNIKGARLQHGHGVLHGHVGSMYWGALAFEQNPRLVRGRRRGPGHGRSTYTRISVCVDDLFCEPCVRRASRRCAASTKEKEQLRVAVIAGAAAAALLLAVGAFCFYRRRKASMMDKADEPSGANPEPTELSPPEEATTPKEEEVARKPRRHLPSNRRRRPRRWFSRAEPRACRAEGRGDITTR